MSWLIIGENGVFETDNPTAQKIAERFIDTYQCRIQMEWSNCGCECPVWEAGNCPIPDEVEHDWNELQKNKNNE